MKSIYLQILFISRPRIWLYTLGSFLFGVQLAFLSGYSVAAQEIALLCLLLTVPVNVFIYALNDYFDFDSDALNPKKNTFEYRSEKPDIRLLYIAVAALLVVSLGMLSQEVLIIKMFVLWLVIILSYNIPPLRFKARPGLDMFFAMNFPLWGFIGYVTATHSLPDLNVLIPVVCLAAVFHLYTALHDIPHDKRAGVITSAVWVGTIKKNILLCVALTIFTIGVLTYFGWFWVSVPLLIYVIFFSLHLFDTILRRDLLYAYKYFIGIQYIVGILAAFFLLMYV